MNMLSCQCWEMPLGHYQISVGASHSLHLIRFSSCLVHLIVFFHIFLSFTTLIELLSVGNLGICWLGETSTTCTWTSCSFKWWRSSDWCLLGSLISVRWYKWQNSSCHWCRSLPTSCWVPAVSRKHLQTSLVFDFVTFLLIWYFMHVF